MQEYCTCVFGLLSVRVTKIFRHTDIKIAYRTNNTIQEKVTPKTHNHEKFPPSGIYKLTCPDYGKAYTGQRGRNFSKRYNEHLRALRNNCNSSKFSHRINDHLYTFGFTENFMHILNYQKRGPHLSTIERFYIQKEVSSENELNVKQTIFPSKIFDAI